MFLLCFQNLFVQAEYRILMQTEKMVSGGMDPQLHWPFDLQEWSLLMKMAADM